MIISCNMILRNFRPKSPIPLPPTFIFTCHWNISNDFATHFRIIVYFKPIYHIFVVSKQIKDYVTSIIHFKLLISTLIVQNHVNRL